jgi:hypothetical protein
MPIANGYVNTAVPHASGASAVKLLESARTVFDELKREFVLWAPSDDHDLVDAATVGGGKRQESVSPAMVIDHPLPESSSMTIRVVCSEDDAKVFGDVAERGYELPGLALLQQYHDSYNAPGSTWAIAFDDETPVSVAAGFLAGETGGLYYVATPPEFWGRRHLVGHERTVPTRRLGSDAASE